MHILAADTYGPAQFGTDLLAAAQNVLPYIGGAVGAGLVVFALTWGIRKGIATVRSVGK